MVHVPGRDFSATMASSSIAGGFVLVPIASLLACWRACQSRPLGIGDFRAWLACREMKARRCVLEEGRPSAFTFAELARISGVSRKRAGASVSRLADAGLLVWSEPAIGFPDPPTWGLDLEDTIGRGRGAVAIPRRMLRFLAAGGRPALIATALGVLLRCLSRRRRGFEGRGMVKASWIARAFGVDLRRVKAARLELIALGWIEPEASDQWALNRWGRAYRIRLDWDRDGSGGRCLPPPAAVEGPPLPPPESDQEPFQEEIRNQEPASGEPTGVVLEGSGDGRRPLPEPTLGDVRPEDLKDTERLFELHGQAIKRKFIGSSEADRLRFVAAAEHALAVGKANPPGLFAYLVFGGCWRYLTGADEDRANARIKAYLRGSAPPSVAKASPSRPPLSEDARLVLKVRSAMAAARYRGDPFPQVRRHDPSWTRNRWEAALSELGTSGVVR